MRYGETGSSIRTRSRGIWGLSLWLGLALSSGSWLPAKAQTDLQRKMDTMPEMTLSQTPAVHSRRQVLQGTVSDASDAAVPGARVVLTAQDTGTERETTAGEDGSFAFVSTSPGTYIITVERDGFEPWRGPTTLTESDEAALVGVVLHTAALSTTLEVHASVREIAEAQMELEEKQRVLGVFPNFYASYAPDAEPLSQGQKFRLAWRFVNDPVALAIAGVTAGSEQRADAFHGYGGGSFGYAKRYGAAYADGLTSTMLGQALLPALFHQDPRYFVKGTGSVGSRVLYAVASMVICKGDNRRWQPNYSNVLGNFAAASVSNAYYPSANRGGGLVVQTAVMATAMGAVGGLFQEFVLHRMTPHVPDYESVR